MRILTRYILRQHVGPFVFALTALTALMLLDQVAKKLDKLVGKGLGLDVIGEVFLYSLPFILAVILPMAVLVAVLYTFNRLAADNEIAAMRANGVPLLRIMLPLLGVATLLAGGMVWFNDTVLPESNHRLARLLVSIARKKPTFVLEHEQMINEVLPGALYLQAAEIDRAESELRDVAIYDERLTGRARTFYADSAEMAFNEDQTVLYLTLYDGVMHESDTGSPETHQTVHFRTQVMRVPEIGNTLERDAGDFRGDRELPIRAMRAEADTALQLARYASERSRALAFELTRKMLGDPLTTREAEEDPSRPRRRPGGRGTRLKTGVRVPLDIGDIFGNESGARARARRWERTTQRVRDTGSATGGSSGGAASASGEADAASGRASGSGADAAGNPRVDPAIDPGIGSAATDLAGVPNTELVREARLQARTVDDPGDAVAAFEGHLRDRQTGRQRAARFEVEIQKKFSIPAACIVFVLIGAPIAVLYRRAGVGLVVAVSLGVFCLYYVALIGGEHLADKNVLSPFWAMWLINVLFGIVGVFLLWRARRVHA